MRRLVKYTAPLLLLLLAGCQRDHLYYASSQTASVLVEPDWSV